MALNNEEIYKEHFRARGVKFINHYPTANLAHPTDEQILALERVPHVWTVGDRYYKLANKFYGDSTLWWIIAWYNQKPTEAHVAIGDTIYVPLPLHKILAFLRNK